MRKLGANHHPLLGGNCSVFDGRSGHDYRRFEEPTLPGNSRGVSIRLRARCRCRRERTAAAGGFPEPLLRTPDGDRRGSRYGVGPLLLGALLGFETRAVRVVGDGRAETLVPFLRCG